MLGVLMKDFLVTVAQQIEVIFIDEAAEILCELFCITFSVHLHIKLILWNV